MNKIEIEGIEHIKRKTHPTQKKLNKNKNKTYARSCNCDQFI
jgi:hypothetical protein